MKRIFFSTALIAALGLPVFAGTEMAASDSKDVKQVATEP